MRISCLLSLSSNSVPSAASLMFHGSLRAGEILPRSPKYYRKKQTCMPEVTLSYSPPSCLHKFVEDIEQCTDRINGRRIRFLKIAIKLPKEDPTGQLTTMVEMFEQPGLFFCPVSAYTKYAKLWDGLTPGLPAFRRQDGLGYDRAALCRDLKSLLVGIFDYSNNRIASHSFRAVSTDCS